MVAWYAYLFHLIEEDDLALEISETLESCQNLYGEVIPTIEQYRKDILVKYEGVKEQLSGSDGKVKSPRILKSSFN